LVQSNRYIFNSQRLGFRAWCDTDLNAMVAISGDEEVMTFFPNTQDRTYTKDFIERMQQEYLQRGYCYFAVELLESGEFIGFLGLHLQEFESDFTPCTDIGWRFKKEVWNRGLAREGAKRCLEYGFENLGLPKIYSITPKINLKSERIMQKAGMQKEKDFEFILLRENESLRNCVLYSISK
jgi:RimJ/RimL family protein N-acetyltransferase